MTKQWLIRRAVRRPPSRRTTARHEFVRVQAALHERLSLAGLDERDGFLGSRMAVGRVHDPHAGEVRREAGGGCGDLVPRPDEDRIDDPERGGLPGGAERAPVAGMDHGDLQPRQGLRRREQAVVLLVPAWLGRRALG